MNNKNEKGTDYLVVILRWIGVLPAAVAGILIGPLIVNIVTAIDRWFMGASSTGGWAFITYFLISPAIGAALSVYWGAAIAPRGKKIVALIIGVLIAILAVITIMGMILAPEPYAWWYIGSGVTSIIAASAIVFEFFVQGDDFNLFD